MKYNILKLSVTLLILCFSLYVHAYNTFINGIYYNLDATTMVAEVTYNDRMHGNEESYSGEVIIPAFIQIDDATYIVKGIGDRAFMGCKNIAQVIIPLGVTSIGNYAFSTCESLVALSLPNSITSIGEGAFEKCKGLTTMSIPNKVKEIGSIAFDGCEGLQTLTIGEEVKHIGRMAFCDCKRLETVYISNLSSWCNLKFEDKNANPLQYAQHLYVNGKEVTDIVIPDGITSINDYAFYCFFNMTSVTFPNSVTSIGNYAFYCCEGLSSITIPNQVTSIGKWAFYLCKGLTSLAIPEHITKIEEGAFSSCFGLKSLTIPNSVTSISSCAFLGCNKLHTITISRNVSLIASEAFCGITDLQDIYCYAEVVPSTLYDAFINNHLRNVTLHVPSLVLEDYLSASPWNQFGHVVPMTEEETAINQIEVTSDINTEWYTLDGRKLYGKPTEKGVYINKGKKVYVK